MLMNADLSVIAKKMSRFEKTIAFETTSEKELELAIDALRYDYVTNFHVGTISYSFDRQKNLGYLKPEYLYSQFEYDAIIKELLKKLSEIKKDIICLSSDLEKEFFIHDWICKNVKYSDNGRDSHSIVGPLLYGVGVCEGMSKTAQALFKIANIESHVICGKALREDKTEVPHSWNSVCLGGKWCLLDITFDNTLSDETIRYDYFNIDPFDLKQTHIPDKNYVLLFDKCVSGSSYFDINNLKFDSFIDSSCYLKKELKNKSKAIYYKIIYGIDDSFVNKTKDYILGFRNVESITFSPNKKIGILFFNIKYRLTSLKLNLW